MSKILIDYNEALRLVNDEIAKEGPGFIYGSPNPASCVNTEVVNDEIVGSCLVGRALIAAGVNAERLHAEAEIYDISMTVIKLEDVFTLTEKSLDFLQDVQNYQDDAQEWGVAVERATLNATENGYDDTKWLYA